MSKVIEMILFFVVFEFICIVWESVNRMLVIKRVNVKVWFCENNVLMFNMNVIEVLIVENRLIIMMCWFVLLL